MTERAEIVRVYSEGKEQPEARFCGSQIEVKPYRNDMAYH